MSRTEKKTRLKWPTGGGSWPKPDMDPVGGAYEPDPDDDAWWRKIDPDEVGIDIGWFLV